MQTFNRWYAEEKKFYKFQLNSLDRVSLDEKLLCWQNVSKELQSMIYVQIKNQTDLKFKKEEIKIAKTIWK